MAILFIAGIVLLGAGVMLVLRARAWSSGGTTETFTSERVVNAAGLDCDRVAALAGIDGDALG